MLFVRPLETEALVGILMIVEGAHYLIYKLLHMAYTYFLLFNVKVVPGMLFRFGVFWRETEGLQMLVSGALSLVATTVVYRDSGRLLDIYRRTPERKPCDVRPRRGDNAQSELNTWRADGRRPPRSPRSERCTYLLP